MAKELIGDSKLIKLAMNYEPLILCFPRDPYNDESNREWRLPVNDGWTYPDVGQLISEKVEAVEKNPASERT